MSQLHYMKNIPGEEVLELAALVEAGPGQVVSRTLAQNRAVSVTLFAFAQGEEISTHQSEGDAMVTVLEGTGKFTVDGVEQERTLLNEDTYNASKAIYRVGPSLPVTLPTETQDPTAGGTAGGETSPAETGPVTGVDGGPGVSPQPSGQDSGTGGGESAPAPAPTEGAAGPGADSGSAAPAPAQILPVSPEAGA